MRIGDAFVTTVCGFGTPPKDWDLNNKSEKRNAGSIVIRLYYKGKSILICGDAVGRHIDDPADACIATEKFMVDMSEVITIDSDVIIAPHHGADNGSSTPFIKKVAPKWVIFPAGHAHEHPREAAAKRYLANGVDEDHIFRTDKGDDEGGDEWDHQRVNGAKDKKGDDDVEIKITSAGVVTVTQ